MPQEIILKILTKITKSDIIKNTEGIMVILIGGAGCVGKTSMAQKLLEIYKMPYLSIDHLKMGIFRGCSNCGFTPESQDKIITKKLWPIIKGIIMTNIENNQNIIIEGCYFPESIGEIGKEYLSKIIMLYIIFSEEYIKENMYTKITENMDIIEKREKELGKTIDQYIIENRNNRMICLKNGIRFFEINKNYKTEVDKIYEWINEEWERMK
jgi:putative acetyltransferase